jgi:hypothetical protein
VLDAEGKPCPGAQNPMLQKMLRDQETCRFHGPSPRGSGSCF